MSIPLAAAIIALALAILTLWMERRRQRESTLARIARLQGTIAAWRAAERAHIRDPHVIGPVCVELHRINAAQAQQELAFLGAQHAQI